MNDLKTIVSEGGKVILVLASLGLYWRVLELSYAIDDKTLFTSLAAVAGGSIGTILGYWFGSARSRQDNKDAENVEK